MEMQGTQNSDFKIEQAGKLILPDFKTTVIKKVTVIKTMWF